LQAGFQVGSRSWYACEDTLPAVPLRWSRHTRGGLYSRPFEPHPLCHFERQREIFRAARQM